MRTAGAGRARDARARAGRTRNGPRGVPRTLLLALALALALPLLSCAGCITVRAVPDAVELAAPIVELDVSRDHGVLLVDAMIDGHGPYRLVLDTGAGVLTLSPRVVEEVGLSKRRFPWRLQSATGARWGWLATGKVGELRLGDRVRIDSMRFIEHELPFGADGLLGNGILEHCALKVDPEQQRIWLTTEMSEPGPADVPLDLVNGVPIVEIDLGGRTVRATLDTGSAGTLDLSPDLEDELPLAAGSGAVFSQSLHGPHTLRVRRYLGAIRLGDVVIDRPFLRFGAGPPLLGLPLLRGHAVEIDLRRRVLRVGSAVRLPLRGRHCPR